MVENLDLAQSLIERDIAFASLHNSVEVDGVTLLLDNVSLLLKNNAASHPRWLEFVKQADALRKVNGCSFPLSISHVLGFFIFEDPRAAKLGIKSEEEIFENDKSLIANVDRILEDKDLRSGLLAASQFLLPDQSGSVGFLGHDTIANLIKSLDIDTGVFLDLGCGVGYNTICWEDQTPLSVIGVDRQYHENWYGEFWKLQLLRTGFVKADFMAGLPFPKDSVSVVLMESVVHNLNSEGLAKGLDEITKVLIPNKGIFVVGPQSSENSFGDWRYFKKVQGVDSRESVLAEQHS